VLEHYDNHVRAAACENSGAHANSYFHALRRYEKLAPVGTVPQTKVTIRQQVDLKGKVPAFVMNKGAVRQLSILTILRQNNDRSLEIDGRNRERFLKRLEAGREHRKYSVKENRSVEKGEE
jgi:hypothetical protein